MSDVKPFSCGVVVRSSGERTTDSCVGICRTFPGIVDCRVVTEVPFEKALKESFVAGMEIGADWTLMLDADVLLSSDCVSVMSEAVSGAGGDMFQYQWRVIDKLFDLPRFAGLRLYSTCHFEMAMKHIPQEGEELRPEAAVKRRVKEQGLHSIQFDGVVGIHDFAQSFADLYRKAGFHTVKFATQLHMLLRLWRQRASTDADFAVAAWAAVDVLEGRFRPSLNRAADTAWVNARLEELQVAEKPGLDTVSETLVHEKISEWSSSASSRRLARLISPGKRHGIRHRFNRRFSRVRVNMERMRIRRSVVPGRCRVRNV